MAQGGGTVKVMVKDQVKAALAALAAEGMPEVEPEVKQEAPPEPSAEEQEGAEKKAKPKAKEEKPRTNGLLETDYTAKGFHLDVQVNPDQVVAAAEILDKEQFTNEAVTGVDWIKEDQMEVVYDYTHMSELLRVVVRARMPRSAPEVPTISKVFPGANWHERETHDFFGIKFLDHPNLAPLLLPEDADYHPLLKDFKA